MSFNVLSSTSYGQMIRREEREGKAELGDFRRQGRITISGVSQTGYFISKDKLLILRVEIHGAEVLLMWVKLQAIYPHESEKYIMG